MTTEEVRDRLAVVDKDEDVFSVENLRLDPNAQQLEVVDAISRILTRRPNKQDWFYAHPEMHLDTYLIEDSRDQENGLYQVAPKLWSALQDELKPTHLAFWVNRQKTYGFWPVKLPNAEGKQSTWAISAFEVLEKARESWVRAVPHQGSGSYIYQFPKSDFGPPSWPETYDLQALLDIAFKDRRIASLDHPFLKYLRGEQ
jgi:hypothetical protein